MGRAIDDVVGSAAIYSWTTSAPATSPEFRTFSVADAVSTVKSEYAKEVYDKPCLRDEASQQGVRPKTTWMDGSGPYPNG